MGRGERKLERETRVQGGSRLKINRCARTVDVDSGGRSLRPRGRRAVCWLANTIQGTSAGGTLRGV